MLQKEILVCVRYFSFMLNLFQHQKNAEL